MSEINTRIAPEGDPTPVEEGNTSGQEGRTFTQDEVNRIISERLARERAKAEPDPIDEREKALAARESAMACREYITDKGYPVELMDILDTSDHEKFRARVEKLDGVVSLLPKDREKPPFTVPIATGPTNGSLLGLNDPVASAFRRKDG